jgi:sensor histidine kinase YesM
MVPVSSISKDINSLALKILVVSLVCILFCVFTAILFSKKISTPLINLSNKVLSYRHSANIQDNDIQNKDEISLLTEEYDKIVDRLETTIHDLMKEQEEKRKAELQALQMQINPHFLYNTLNSIQCLVWTNKTKFIGPTIKALVNLLQQTIGGKNEFITLEEELNILDNYVYLHKIRTCDTICFTYELEESLKKYKTPRLLLQPIVENSIFHGLEPKGSKGAISVKCTSDKHDIVIEIKDNGIGMKQSRVTEILSGKIDSPEDSFSGIGIKNVDERIKSYFGKQYGLSIVSAPGEGTTVTVRFKKIRNKKVEYDV